MINPIFKLKSVISREKDIAHQIAFQQDYQVQFYNCWNQPNEQMYWNQFIQAHHMLDECPQMQVAVFSVFGSRKIISRIHTDVKIFYSAENLERFPSYLGYGLDDPSIDLAMGFDNINDERYIRFPLWMDYMFPADSSEQYIRQKCAQIRYPMTENNRKFCCMVASNSADGLRDEMLDKISLIEPVDSAGRYRHNDDSLQTLCADNKLVYLQRYLFNICPENTNSDGYVSEKIFESISQGCIPIYWGDHNNAEPRVLNQDAIIYWDRENGGIQALKKISELNSNQKLLRDFLAQPRLLPTAEEFILDTYSSIEHKLHSIISSKKYD